MRTARDCMGKTAKEKAEWLNDCLINFKDSIERKENELERLKLDIERMKSEYKQDQELLVKLQKKAAKEQV